MPQDSAIQKQRIYELDGLRGIAAIMVVLFHYFFRYNKIYGHSNLNVAWAKYGELGVQLFFIISGYVIFWSLNRINKPVDFVYYRFSRLYPTYWAAIIITCTLVYVYGLPGRTVSPTNVGWNFFMFHNYFGVPNVDGVYWSLKIELTFYLWIFITYKLRILNRIDYVMLLMLLVTTLFKFNLIDLHDVSKRLLLVQWGPFFFIGIGLFKIKENLGTWLTYLIVISSLWVTYLTFSMEHSMIFLFFTIIFYLATTGKIPFLKNRVLLFLGSISYALYLIHQNIGYIIINSAYAHHLPPIVGIGLAFLCCLIIAYALHRLVEKPSLIFLRQLYKRLTRNRSLHSSNE